MGPGSWKTGQAVRALAFSGTDPREKPDLAQAQPEPSLGWGTQSLGLAGDSMALSLAYRKESNLLFPAPGGLV